MMHPPIVAVPPPPPVRMVAPSAKPYRARANLQDYFSVDDYPAAALRANAEGTTTVRLTVAENGRVSNCVVTGSSGSDALDTATCRILRSRARYAPAREPRGDPVVSIDSEIIIWRLPGG